MPPVRLTARDQQMAAWVGRWQPATAMQVAFRFDLARAIAYRRLKALTTLGYLRHERRVHELPGVYVLTDAGYELTGVERTSRLRSPRELWSWFAAVDHSVVLERAGYDCIPSPELAGHLPLVRRMPHREEEPVYPEVFADGAEPVAIYCVVGPAGVLDGPSTRLLRMITELEPTADVEIRVLAAESALARVRDTLGDRVTLVGLDPAQIGTPRARQP